MQNPKILHVLNTYLPETENWLFSLLNSVSLYKHHIFSIHQKNSKYFVDDFKFYQPKVGKILEKIWGLNKRNLLFIFIWLYYKFTILFSKSPVSSLRNTINLVKPDIIHFHFGDVAVTFKEVINNFNIPVVVSFYGHDYEYLPHTNPGILNDYKSLFQKEITFICEGSHGKSILINHGCPANKIKVLRLGVDYFQFPKNENIKPKNQLNLIQVASFTEKKGHIYSVKAFHKAISKCPNLQLTLVGDDRDKVSKILVEGYIKENNLSSVVDLIDFIPTEKIHRYMTGFDVFIHPSCYSKNKDCEGGAPIILLEAQALGIPIISTIHCDIPEEVVDKKTGILCEEKSVLQLSSAIESFYRMDTSKYLEYSLKAKIHVNENYDIKKNAILFNNLYSHLIMNND